MSDIDQQDVQQDVQQLGVYEWPALGLEEAIDYLVTMGRSPYPFPVTVYAEAGATESGIVGYILPDGQLIRYDPKPAPQPGVYWADECACFRPSTVVWNGVIAGGVERTSVAGASVLKRNYEASIMGDWPLHPPRAAKPVNPERARLAEMLDAEREAA